MKSVLIPKDIKTMKTGKLDFDILKGLLERHTIIDPRVVIGQVKKGKPRVLAIDEKGIREIPPFSRDEILKIYSNGIVE